MLFRRKRKGEELYQPVSAPDDDNSDKKPVNVVSQTNAEALATLQKLADQSQKVLLTISSIFPYDLIPDTLTIDENKVNFIRKEIFGAENIHSVLIEDITNITVNTGPFMASLEIIDSSNVRFPITYSIKHLKINKANLARRLIQGLITAKRSGVDLSSCNEKDLLKTLETLGHARGESVK